MVQFKNIIERQVENVRDVFIRFIRFIRLVIAYDTLSMSIKTKNPTVADMRKLNKIVRKAKEGDLVVTLKRIGKLADIKNID